MGYILINEDEKRGAYFTSKAELARELNVHPRTIWLWEKDGPIKELGAHTIWFNSQIRKCQKKGNDNITNKAKKSDQNNWD